MRILLINRNGTMQGGADRVYLNTLDLLNNAGGEANTTNETLLRPPSPARNERGRGAGGEANTTNETLLRPPSPASSTSKGEGAWGEAGAGEVSEFEGLTVSAFTREDASVDTSIDPRDLGFFGKLKHLKNYLYNKQVADSLEERILEFKPDIAHIHLIFGTLSMSVLSVLKKHRIPVMMTLHDYRLICPANAMLDRHGKVCERCKKTRYWQCLLHRCAEGNLFFSTVIILEAYLRKYWLKPVKLVNHFIFVSQFAMDKHIEFDPRYKGKSSMLYNMTILPDKTNPIKGDYLLYYGRLSREKGIMTLLEAVRNIGVKLIIAGTGPQEEELRRLRDQETKRLGDLVSFVGFKTGKELEELIRGSAFVVLPSEWYENNPMTVVEAFSFGKPVIGTMIGGIPELIGESRGFLFESGDASSLADTIEKAMKMKDEKYNSMSDACRTFAEEQFDPGLHLNHLLEVYKTVLN